MRIGMPADAPVSNIQPIIHGHLKSHFVARRKVLEARQCRLACQMMCRRRVASQLLMDTSGVSFHVTVISGRPTSKEGGFEKNLAMA